MDTTDPNAGTGPTNPDPPPKKSLPDLLEEANWRNDFLVHEGEAKLLAVMDGTWSLAVDGDHRVTFNDFIKLLNLKGATVERDGTFTKGDVRRALRSVERDGERWAVVSPI